MPGSPARWRTARPWCSPRTSPPAHALLDFRLYLPKAWCADQARREKAHVPEDTAFAAKPDLGAQMITGAARHPDPFAWVAANEVYGRSWKLRRAEEAGKGYVLAVPVNFTVTLPVRAQGDGCRGGRDGADGVRDPRSCGARLQGPPRLRLGLARHRLAAALASCAGGLLRPV